MNHHLPIPRRRREGVTDYGARKKAVISRRVQLVVRVSGKNVTAQFIRPEVDGDMVVASAHSRALKSLKWSGSLKSVPACYLLGLLAGRTALEKGVKDAVLYSGVLPFVKGSRVAAVAKGVKDAGVSIPVSESAFPAEERLTGKQIAGYASSLLKDDKAAYQKRFSALLKSGFKPEDYPANFERTKSIISGGKTT